jgi:hypothetical protein
MQVHAEMRRREEGQQSGRGAFRNFVHLGCGWADLADPLAHGCGALGPRKEADGDDLLLGEPVLGRGSAAFLGGLPYGTANLT